MGYCGRDAQEIEREERNGRERKREGNATITGLLWIDRRWERGGDKKERELEMGKREGVGV